MTQALITTSEIATRYDVPIRTVQYWCKIGKLPSKKFGRDWVVDEDDIRKFMAERETSNKTEE